MPVKHYLTLTAMVLVGIVGGIGWYYFTPSDSSITSEEGKHAKRFANLYLFEGSFTHFEKGKRVFTLEAEEVIHRKRKLGPFTINPIKEMVFHNVRITLHDMSYLNSRERSQTSMPSRREYAETFQLPLHGIFQKTFGDLQLGFISRIIIHGITMEAKQEEKGFTLFAKKAKFGIKKSNIAFEDGFSLTGKNGQRVVSHRAEWKAKKEAFYIPGMFVLKTNEKEQASSNAYFSLLASGNIEQRSRVVHN